MNFDCDNFDFRPRTRRTNGGLNGIAARLACHGDLGSSESKTQQTETQQQVTVQGGGAGSFTLAAGAGASVSGDIKITSADPAVAEAAIAAASVNQTNTLMFAGQAINAGAEIVQQIESNNAQIVGYSDQTIQNLGADLAYAAGVQNPVTGQPTDAGTVTATATGTTDWQTIIFVGAALLSVYVFLRSGGKTT